MTKQRMSGADLGGRVHGMRTPSWNNLPLCNTTDILQKSVVYWYQSSGAPPPKKKSWIRLCML